MQVTSDLKRYIQTAIEYSNSLDVVVERLYAERLPLTVALLYVYLIKRNGRGKDKAKLALDALDDLKSDLDSNLKDEDFILLDMYFSNVWPSNL